MFYAVNIKWIFRRVILLLFIVFAAYICVTGTNRLFPLKYTEYITEFSEKYGLEQAFVYAVINAESRFNPEAVSHKNARGLMQLMEGTAEWGAVEIGMPEYNNGRIHEPRINIEIGCWYLAKLLTQYGGDLTVALAAYNAGSGNVSKWLQNESYSNDGMGLNYIPFKETRNYIEKISFYIKVYEIRLKLHGLLF